MFETLVQEILRETARRQPAWASSEGLREYDSLLAEATPEAYAARLADLTAWLARVDGPDGADADAVDRDALRFTLDLERFGLETLRTHERNPDLASELMDHLLPLLLRTSQPLAERVAAMAERLEGARTFLESGRRRVVLPEVPPLWVEVAIESASSSPTFLDAVRRAGEATPPDVRARLDAAAESAGRALADHLAWLEHEVRAGAKGDWAIGRERFEALLRRRLISRTTEDLWRLGHESVARFREETREAALTVLAEAGRAPGVDPVREAVEVVGRDHPTSFAEVLGEYRAAIEDARRFVVARGLATVPDVPLDVVETPAYLRHLVPFAAYIQPPRFDAAPRGTYLVTPKVDLAAFPRADIRNTTVHEAYPGHHLQLARAREVPSLARFLVGASAPDMLEGWALYCEAMMGRHGYSARPAERFVRAKDTLWRAVRIVLDVGLHTRRLGFDEALAMLVAETGMTRAEAEAEVKRYTLSPAYNLSYLLGRLEIERVREERERAGGFDERAFHDALLAQGSLPLPLLVRAAFPRR